MKDQPVSPAVVSLQNEQAKQTVKDKTRLDEGLEDTFPASDPVSVVHTATATGATPADAEAHSGEALGLHPVESPRSSSRDSHAEELQAMRRDVEGLRAHIRALATGAGRIARAEANILELRLQKAVSEKPLAIFGLVAAAGYLLGTMHRIRDR